MYYSRWFQLENDTSPELASRETIRLATKPQWQHQTLLERKTGLPGTWLTSSCNISLHWGKRDGLRMGGRGGGAVLFLLGAHPTCDFVLVVNEHFLDNRSVCQSETPAHQFRSNCLLNDLGVTPSSKSIITSGVSDWGVWRRLLFPSNTNQEVLELLKKSTGWRNADGHTN